MPVELSSKHCVPIQPNTSALTPDAAASYLGQIKDWSLSNDGSKVEKTFKRKNFRSALEFVNMIGDIAEDEGHHPDILIHGYSNVTIRLTTHAIGGLSENDFIIAAKIDKINERVN